MIGQMVNQAVSLHQAGRLAEAEVLYRQAIAAGVRDAQVLHLYAAALYQQGRFTEALAAGEAALKVSPGDVEGLLLQGAIQMALKRPREALEPLTRAVAAAPRHGDAWQALGTVRIDLGQLEAAIADFDRALAIQSSPPAWANRASALLGLDRPEEALESANRALQLYPQLAVAWISRGYALHRMNRLAEAVESFDRALAILPDHFPAWLRRGEALWTLGRNDEALESFDRALVLDPASVDAQAQRAGVLSLLVRCDEAIAGYDRALAAAPQRHDIWANRAVALTIVQRFDEAEASIERALAIAPNNPAALLVRGKLLCETGRVEEGLALFAARAAQVYGDASETAPTSEAQHRHDQEQQAYLSARGVAASRFHIDGGDRIAGPAVNPANRQAAALAWAGSDPQIVVIDQLLTEPALEGLRRFCWGSTVWRKPYRQGYVGAFIDHGFACPLLAQIAEELREVFPTVVGDHPLLSTWGFKYDSRLGGIRIHADQAAVNVNFWITPDEANLNPDSGGMVIWDAAAPADWAITRYNGDDDAVRAFLSEANSQSTSVPYRANRAVIFDSDLFHETDRIEFKDGYLNRRINVTMLYGRRNFTNT